MLRSVEFWDETEQRVGGWDKRSYPTRAPMRGKKGRRRKADSGAYVVTIIIYYNYTIPTIATIAISAVSSVECGLLLLLQATVGLPGL